MAESMIEQEDSPESAQIGIVELPLEEAETNIAQTRSHSDMSSLFSFSTDDIPTIPFDVNGERYELRTMAHLSPDQESEARYLFRRDDELFAEFRKCPGKDKEKLLQINQKIREIRVRIIVMMSDLPEDLVRQLKVHQQGKILKYIGADPEDVIREAAEASGEDIKGL